MRECLLQCDIRMRDSQADMRVFMLIGDEISLVDVAGSQVDVR